MSESAEKSKVPDRPAWRNWLRIAISVILLAVVASQIDLSKTGQLLASARPDLTALAALVALAGRFFAAFRWYLLLHGKNAAVTYPRILRLTFVSNFLGFFLPGSIGVEVTRVYGLSRTTADLALSFSSVVVERALGMIALAAMALVGLALAPPGIPPNFSVLAWLGFGLGLAGSAAIMNPVLRRWFDWPLSPKLMHPIRKRLHKFYACLDDYKAQPVLMFWSIMAAGMATLFRIVPAILCAWALDVDVTFVHLLIFIPIRAFWSQIPISIGGLGLNELGFIVLFGMVGASADQAVSFSLLLYAVTVATSLPGAWFYARGGLAPTRGERFTPQR
jgi:uncharacterized membrane protein YbhN (UPF0104 family)